MCSSQEQRQYSIVHNIQNINSQNISCDLSEGLDPHMRLIMSSLLIVAIMSLSAARTINADMMLSEKLVRKRFFYQFKFAQSTLSRGTGYRQTAQYAVKHIQIWITRQICQQFERAKKAVVSPLPFSQALVRPCQKLTRPETEHCRQK